MRRRRGRLTSVRADQYRQLQIRLTDQVEDQLLVAQKTIRWVIEGPLKSPITLRSEGSLRCDPAWARNSDEQMFGHVVPDGRVPAPIEDIGWRLNRIDASATAALVPCRGTQPAMFTALRRRRCSHEVGQAR